MSAATAPQSGYPATLQSVMDQVLPNGGWEATALDGGMTNLNWRVTESGQERELFVQLMMPADRAAEVGILRDVQRLALGVAHDLGIAPATVALLDEPAAIVTEFVIASPLPEAGPDRARALADLSGMLRRLHAVPAGPEFQSLCSDGFIGARWMADQARRADPLKAQRLASTFALLDALEAERGPYTRTLIHNDPSVNNILVADKTYLIDWEYAGLGDPLYDLGDMLWKCTLSADEQRAVIANYAGEYDPAVHAIVVVYSWVGLLRETLWAAVAGAQGFSEFDHAGYFEDCLARLNAIAASEDFHWARSLLPHRAGLAS